MARVGQLAIVALVAVAAFLVWHSHRRADRAEQEAGLASARILESVFERTSALEVATLRGRAQARSQDDGWFASSQMTRAPFSVVYTVDLRVLDRAHYHWNAGARIMTVDVPAVAVGAPAIDMANAQTTQDGIWISRRAGQALQHTAAIRLNAVATVEAHKPERVASAQQAARAAIGALTTAPLAAAGLPDVRVVIRMPGESRPPALSQEQWNVSRSIADVYREAVR